MLITASYTYNILFHYKEFVLVVGFVKLSFSSDLRQISVS